MLTPDEIIAKARRKYPDVLRAYLTHTVCFPLEFPVGRLSSDLAERRRQIDALRQKSKEHTEQGYTLVWETTQQRDLGKQTIPQRVTIETLDDYLALLRKRGEYQKFVADVDVITRRFPALTDWLIVNPLKVVEHSGHWPDLLTVCAYFVAQPRPSLYLRELPIAVHTKFIEQHSRILRELLDVLLPADANHAPTASDFSQRFGLKTPPTTLRLRLLEEQLDWHYGLRIDDLTLPVKQAAHLLAQHVRPKTVIIVENLINFLTLPAHPGAVGLFGQGFAIHTLADVPWLNQCNVLYWGDIDAHGFQILADLRRLFPHVRSVMMDRATFEAYSDFVVAGSPLRSERFDSLTEDEAALARYISDHHASLEQEHIPHDYALAQLKHALSPAP